MNSKKLLAVGVATAAVFAMSACSGGEAEGGDNTLTLSGWSLSSTPEFQVLADGFEAKTGTKVELKEYDSSEYNTLLTADLAAGTGPDIVTQKEVKFVSTLVDGGQLLDVSDVQIPEGSTGADSYTVDGVRYAVPYRHDGWVLYYNKDLFEQAGVDEPDGSWTWDDYVTAAEALSEAGGDDYKGTYQHTWQSTVQGFAQAQTAGADLLTGDYSYLTPYYERSLALQESGAQTDYNTAKANQLTYQGEFGKQSAAMLPMGAWYTATLVTQQASGEADDFEWGIAPVPQADASTTGEGAVPVTFGDPTGFGINANIDDSKTEAAKQFLAYAASEEAAVSLAEIAIKPALNNDAVTEAYFGVEGMPTDELSQTTLSTADIRPESPLSSRTAPIQTILEDLHTAVMSGSEPIDSAVTSAQDRVASEVPAE